MKILTELALTGLKNCIINEMGKKVWEYSMDEMFIFYNIRNMPHKPMLGRMLIN
jgi:hypothetical protein